MIFIVNKLANVVVQLKLLHGEWELQLLKTIFDIFATCKFERKRERDLAETLQIRERKRDLAEALKEKNEIKRQKRYSK
jgi:hypothetical protein